MQNDNKIKVWEHNLLNIKRFSGNFVAETPDYVENRMIF